MEGQIHFGAYAIPAILTVILAITYKFITFGDQYKALVAVCVGIGLGILAIPYNGLEWTAVIVIDNCINGLMIGASAVGLYELQRTATNPRG